MFAGCSISSLETSSCPLMRRMARKMSHVETLRFVHMPSVQSPRFTAIGKCWKGNILIDLKLTVVKVRGPGGSAPAPISAPAIV